MGFANSDNDEYKLESLQQKMDYFYMDPQESIAKEIILELSQLENLDNFCIAFSVLAAKYPDKILKWVDEAKIDFHKHSILLTSLHIAGLQSQAIELAKKEKFPPEEIIPLERSLIEIKNMPYSFYGFSHWMFSEFIVTGDIEYVKNIINVFDLSDKDIEEPDKIKDIHKEAKTILKHLIFMHNRIYQFCKEEVKSSQKKSKAILVELLSDLDKGLKGTISISDDPNYEKNWYTLPVMAGPKCRDAITFPYPPRNKPIKIFIIFNGFELDKDSCADLTYDYEIFNSKKVKIASAQDLLAIKRKIYSRFFYQLAEEVPTFTCINNTSNEKKGTFSPGIYVVKVILKDQISKKSLKLESFLQFLPK